MNPLLQRPRRNRVNASLRALVTENRVHVDDLVLPLFLQEPDSSEPVEAMPGVSRLGLNPLLHALESALKLGIKAFALFPVIPSEKKDAKASESLNAKGLLPRALREIKKQLPEAFLITDVAMDPYSSDGHDGLVETGRIHNDKTLKILADMALVQAEAGADMVAPSDMMDGRVGAIRSALDRKGFHDVGILSYCAKYASAFYGPFREALDSAPVEREGIPPDKKTYQMDPANRREALREAELDVAEGADVLMVKPGLPYLDVISDLKRSTTLPITAYQVSGEYAMICAAAERGWLSRQDAVSESLLSLKRAGADIIFTYFAVEAARYLAGK